jgi:hypothetical protein
VKAVVKADELDLEGKCTRKISVTKKWRRKFSSSS